MSAFKVGQRVRIVNSTYGETVGKEATVVGFLACWVCVEVDNYPNHPIHGPWRADPSWLRPLTNPDESAWNEFKSRHLTPDPILAKEPA